MDVAPEHRVQVVPAPKVIEKEMLQATGFGLALSACAALIFVVLRAHYGSETFGVPLSAVARAVALAWALMLLPLLFGGRHGIRSTAIVCMTVIGLAFAPTATWILLDVSTCAAILAGMVMVFRRSLGWSYEGVIIILTALGAAIALSLINLSHNYSTPLALEATMVGLNHHDTLFHAAIASNLRSSGIISIGADGIAPLVYHVFSHRVIGGFAIWTAIPILHAYALFTAVVSVPVMLTFLTQVSAQLISPSIRPELRSTLFFSVLIYLAFGGAIMWHSYYSSESYTFSLWFLLLASVLLWRLNSTPYAFWQKVIVFVLLAVIVCIAALSKISVGAVLGSAVAVGVSAFGHYKVRYVLLSAAVGVLPAVAVYLLYPVTQDRDAGLFSLFDFFEYEKPAIYALLFAVTLSILVVKRLPPEQERRAMAAALLAGMWAGLISSYVLSTEAGAQFYFSDPGSWLGLLLIPLLGSVPGWLANRREKTGSVLACTVFVLLLALHDRKLEGIERITTLQARLDELPQVSEAGAGESAIAQTAVGNAAVAALSAPEPFDAILVSADHQEFWTSQNVCWAATLVLPALVGKPMLQGIVPERYDCSYTSFYGFADYDFSAGRPPAVISSETICPAATQRGFGSVLAISPNRVQRIDCRS
jgi:hypothetical protein